MHLAGWGGIDQPTTKPVQNEFYAKIINFFIFSKYLLGGPGPGPHGHGHCPFFCLRSRPLKSSYEVCGAL